MKKLSFAIATFAAGIVTFGFIACSNESDMPQFPESENGEIRFAANTEFSRAGDVTTNNLSAFNVYAYIDPSDSTGLFMDNVTVTKTSGNVWTYSPVKYWPAKKSLDFYAYAPESWVGSQDPRRPIPYDSYPGQTDLVYATNMNMRGNEGLPNAQVVFNFRHALSKVTVKLSSSNENLKVCVGNVALANVAGKANFNYPTASTSGNPTAETIGTWTDHNTPMAFVMNWCQVYSDYLVLTTTPTTIPAQGMSLGSTLFLIPQPLTYRSNGNGMDNYITVMCSIYDAKTNTKLWPNDNTPEENLVPGSTFGDGLLKFALSTSKFSEWQPGVHYIYNIVINSNEEMGAIEFGTPTVDSFVEVETNYE